MTSIKKTAKPFQFIWISVKLLIINQIQRTFFNSSNLQLK